MSLYGAKAILPTRAERGQEPMIRRQRHATGSGPNSRRSQQRIRHRIPPPIAQAQALFKRPRCLRRLSDWAFPTLNHALSATDVNDDNNDSISAFDTAHEPCDEDNASPTDQTREEQCPEWIDDTDDSSTISRHSCSPATVPLRNAREKRSHAVIKCQATLSGSSDEYKQTCIISKILT